ncbi:putative stomatin/prohibitin-family membrane protease subunit YbbK [Halarchaeum acidiphilum MH1-52-1]|uniref:Putative stomatin/prohibitin-family membrane protease subunit YbbK n=3 Tax=Halarchaeum acidiphilum TaxID=489138 RepID=U3A3B9_9EURY|nr:putative stomatin/prohibitin-family membrane protease subunit YbbK [Halarchaeum acidiphilum MH1-52-1]
MRRDDSMRRFFRTLGRASARIRPWHALVASVVALTAAFAPAYGWTYLLGVLVVAAVLVVAVESVEIVQAYERRPYTVLGAYKGILGPGINVVPPFVTETHAFDTRTQTAEVPTQEAITRDNSPVRASAVVYLSVVDAERAFLEIDGYRDAVAYLAQTSLRAVIGDMELDDTLSERGTMNDRIHDELDETVAAWGVDVEGVEVKSVMPSDGVVHAMERQSAAERHRRAAILEAKGTRGASIERALGERRAAVLRAEGRKRATILEAQGDAAATVLRARAAESMGERAVIDRGFDALERVGRGAATTYVVPQELTSLVGRYGHHLGGGVSGDESGLDPNDIDLVELDLANVIETPVDADAVEIEVE